MVDRSEVHRITALSDHMIVIKLAAIFTKANHTPASVEMTNCQPGKLLTDL